MASFKINFIKSIIANITPPIKNSNKKGGIYDTYYDTKEAGLVLLVSNGGAKTFYLYRKVDGKPERIKLGKFPDLSVENARKKALKNKGAIADGDNPNEEKKKLRAEITFGEMFEKYLEQHSKKHTKTWKEFEHEIRKHLTDWFGKKASAITKQDLIDFHLKLGNENGQYSANRMIERIRAIYNKAIEWEWNGVNPATRIKMFREKSRDRFLQPNELPIFFEALDVEENETAKDCIMLSLLTGARKSNMLAMRWEEISFERKEWRIPDTKNNEPLTLPLSAQAMEILEARSKENKKNKQSKSPWVFPSNLSESGRFQDPKKTWKRILLRAELYQLIELIAESEEWNKAKIAKAKTEIEVNLKQSLQQYQANAKKLKLAIDGIGLGDLRIHDLRRSLGSWQAVIDPLQSRP